MPWGNVLYSNFGDGIDRRFLPNNPTYPKGSLWDLKNMIYDRSSEDAEKMGGVIQLGENTIGGTCTGLYDYDEGTMQVACSSDGGIYQRSTGNWAAATGGGAGTFNTASTTRWSGTMFYGATTAKRLLVLANDVSGNAPQRYDNSNGVAALGGSPPAAGKFPISANSRVWMAAGDNLFASATNDAEEWVKKDSFNIQVDRGSGDITGLFDAGGRILVFKRNRIYQIPYDTERNTQVLKAHGSIGCVAHHTIAQIQVRGRSAVAFLSDSGLMAVIPTDTTGDWNVQHISEKVKKILDGRSFANQNKAWATFNNERLEYWCQYPTSTAIPSVGLVANMARERGAIRWTRHDRSKLTAGTMAVSAGQDIQIAGTSTGKIYQMHQGHNWDGAGYTGTWFTAAFNQGRMDYMKQYGRWFIDAATRGDYNVFVNASVGRKNLPMPTLKNEQGITDFGNVKGWGQGGWGVALWGGGGISGVHYRCGGVARGHYARLRISTTGSDQWFAVYGLHLESALASNTIAA